MWIQDKIPTVWRLWQDSYQVSAKPEDRVRPCIKNKWPSPPNPTKHTHSRKQVQNMILEKERPCKPQGWRCSLVGRVLALNEQSPQFGPLHQTYQVCCHTPVSRTRGMEVDNEKFKLIHSYKVSLGPAQASWGPIPQKKTSNERTNKKSFWFGL